MTCGLNGTFSYHVHEFAINSTGSCESTGGHLDPLGVGKVPGYVCNPITPKKCEAGDLSGKHGLLQGTSYGYLTTKYTDEFISLRGTNNLDNGIIGRSIVIHSHHSHHIAHGVPAPRIACVNIIKGKCWERNLLCNV
ncbi:superoxide dismutase [Gigaspora rosea]|uniref:Superoxide dismutase n=1 Tax=Gigaspora rosea TaxID=44941 RepID=A0A397TZL4_9GLOM|nr:superoxide dismutase [Gigaspora rosea]